MTKEKKQAWKTVRRTEISVEPVLPGVWRRKVGGHIVRGRATDSRTGKMTEIWKSLPEASASEALVWLQQSLADIRRGVVQEQQQKQPFATYAVSLLARKIAEGDIVSESGKEKWG